MDIPISGKPMRKKKRKRMIIRRKIIFSMRMRLNTMPPLVRKNNMIMMNVKKRSLLCWLVLGIPWELFKFPGW
jgi:hypothetical protein